MSRPYPCSLVALSSFLAVAAAVSAGCSSSSKSTSSQTPTPNEHATAPALARPEPGARATVASSTAGPSTPSAHSGHASSTPPAGASTAAPAPAPAPVMTSASGTDRLFYPTGQRETSMLLLERTGPAKVRVGKPYDYQITVTNLTNSPLHGVTVQELLPASFAVREASSSGDSAEAKPAAAAVEGSAASDKPKDAHADSSRAPRTHMIGELGPRESRTINLSGVPSEAGPINACTSVTCNPTLCTAALAINPQMRLSREAIGSADLCQTQTIHYTVKNTGTGDLTNVRIEDQLPQGFVAEGGSSDRMTIKIGSIPQGQSRTADVKVKASAAGEFSAAPATAAADDEVTAKSEALAMAIKAPKFEVALKVPEREYLGQTLKYEVTVKNVGTASARNPSLRIDGPDDVAAAAPGAQGEARLASARDTSREIGELAPGASKTITLPYTARAEGDLRVNAVATDPCAKDAMASAVTRVTGIPALLLSAVDDHDPIRVGEEVTYTINVLNQGFGADKNIKVVVTLPEAEQYISSSGASEGKIDGNKLIFAPVATITPKQTLTWTLRVKALKEGDVRLRVDMTTESLTEPAVKMEPTRLY